MTQTKHAVSSDPLTQRFGLLMRRLREEAGISQKDLAQLADLNPSFIARMERGRQKPALHSIYRIAAAFGLSGSELLALLEAMAPGRRRKRADGK